MWLMEILEFFEVFWCEGCIISWCASECRVSDYLSGEIFPFVRDAYCGKDIDEISGNLFGFDVG